VSETFIFQIINQFSNSFLLRFGLICIIVPFAAHSV